MASIAEVREALASAVSQAQVRCEPYVLNAITAPGAQVIRKQMDPRMVFGGSTSAYMFGVVVYVGSAAERSTQVRLDEFCEMSGARSIRAAIEDEDNWPASLVDYAQVTQVGETLLTEVAGAAYLTVEFDVEVVF